jgi:hypothetical protein
MILIYLKMYIFGMKSALIANFFLLFEFIPFFNKFIIHPLLKDYNKF